MRESIFRAFGRYRPPFRGKIQFVPLHSEYFASALSSENSQTKDRCRPRPLSFERIPKLPNLIFAEYSIALLFVARIIDAVRGVRLHNPALDTEIEKP